MPDFATPRNPLDGTGAMYEDARIFPQLFDVLLREEAVDVLAVNLRVNVPKPGGSAPSREFSRAMRDRLRQPTDRLVVAFSSFAGGDLDPEVIQTLAEAGVPFLESTESTMQALRNAREHQRFLDRPVAARPATGAPRASARPVGRGVLANAEAMRIVCGFGGIFVEQLRDVSLRVPPVGRDDAAAMIAELRGAALLSGVRGRPAADVGALADAIVGLAALAEAHQSLRALDLNPLLVL